MADKFLLPHSVVLSNRNELKIEGVVKVISYDEHTITVKTDYGILTVCGSNICANEMRSDKNSLSFTGDIHLMQYRRGKGKSEGLLAKLFK